MQQELFNLFLCLSLESSDSISYSTVRKCKPPSETHPYHHRLTLCCSDCVLTCHKLTMRRGKTTFPNLML